MRKPDKLYIEKNVVDYDLTKKIQRRLNPIETEYIEDYKSVGLDKSITKRAIEDKDSLTLAYKKGEILKNIGRMENEQYYLFHEMDCKYDCEYCYLQYYFQTKTPVIFVNRMDVIDKIREKLNVDNKPYFHVGEICDSLAFDDLTDFSLEIVEMFSGYPNGTVEFRTKSTNISNLLSIPEPPRNVIPSWTVNPQTICETIEHKTPGFHERIEAARKCQEAGYIIGLRIDPIILFDSWEEHYTYMLDYIFSNLNVKNIQDVTLGSVKIHRTLNEVIRKRFPGSILNTGEIFPGEDGKYRYLKFKRVDVYRKLLSIINRFDKSLKVLLSLESDDVEELVFT